MCLICWKDHFIGTAKALKLNRALSFPEGHPLRGAVTARIQAMEKAASGVAVALKGGDTSMLQGALRDDMSAVDDLISRVYSEVQVMALFAERAALLSMIARLKEVNEVLQEPDIGHRELNKLDVN